MKKRILFVDDDPIQRQMYPLVLGTGNDAWEVATARDAEQALLLMEKTPFDVVVSDWIMPGMDGCQLMMEVRQRHPACSRIILSVISDQEKVARSLGDTHQFIAKPFDLKVLKATLSRICGLDQYLKEEKLRVLIANLGTLPSFPSLYCEVMKELASPNSSIESVAAITSRDPAMTAKMLQITNSAVIGLSRRVSSPFEAVEYLGLGTVRSLVLSAHIFSCFEQTLVDSGFIEALWKHSIRCGMLSQKIMRTEGAEQAEAEDAYVAGMLHDVGKLMLASSLPQQFLAALKRAADGGLASTDAELEVFGATHAGAAAYLLGLWGLAVPIVEAVAFHHTPGASDAKTFGILTAVHAANVIEQDYSKIRPPGRAAELDSAYFSSLGVQDRSEVWREAAADLFEKFDRE